MPNGLNNWTAGAVIRFLKKNKFEEKGSRGSHFYYIKGKRSLVCVPVHSRSGTIATGTMKSIIAQSGIPESEWRKR